MPMFNDIRPVLNAHYISDILLAALYFILKHIPGVCSQVFESCRLELREYEWLTFLACVVVLKNRRQATIAQYVSTTCLFTKVLSLICFLNYSATYGLLYILLCLGQTMFLPKPIYKGPESIVYFRGPNLYEEIERDKRVTWMITFYVAWSPKCVNFAPVFSELSNEYKLENLKFGKIDVSRYPAVAEKYNINIGALSRQLPTVILFQNGEEKERRPTPTKHITFKFDFTKENTIKEFGLNDVYYQCKKHLALRKKGAGGDGDTPDDKEAKKEK
ncbi:thioredoxin-related transmembrane protein 2-like protein [Elysia marginata]|uniref:Thioredoxin-related transmembrane protein 2-like protein n=1 Tax=Elysia marginata TaxID=1093978 RepID=A0AAV4J6X6_9GAST|nr:thioredoxin-related transmembrane protein 2-like protein [Elysia marginata]